MSKMQITTEVEVPDDGNKFYKYAVGRAALRKAASQMEEEKASNTFGIKAFRGSFQVREIKNGE